MAASPVAATDEVPLSEGDEEGSPGEIVRKILAAEQAFRFGFSPVAVEIYRSLLGEVDEGDPRRAEIQLGLTAALITEREFDEAREALSGYPNEDDGRYLLRRAAIALAERDEDQLIEVVSLIDPDELPNEEKGWALFLQAIGKNRDGETEEAVRLYEEALETSPTVEQVAAFSLAWQRARLVEGEVDEAMAEELKRQMNEFEGRTAGYRFAQQYVVVLEQLGERAEASAVIRSQLQEIPSGEREIRDQFLLLDGLITGAERGAGRASLRQLLRDGEDRALQRIALRTLSATLQPEEWNQFNQFLGELIESEHQLLDEILVFRAQLALRGAGLAESEERRNLRRERAIEDAETLLTRFPGSRYKPEALEVLAAGAWEQRRYRTAANYLTQLRDELEPGKRRSQLGLLVADCYFRAGEVNRSTEDFRNAADAYGSVLRELPDGVSTGRILFNRVVAEINGNRLERAVDHLEETNLDAGDMTHRWKAEWNLVKAMQRGGDMQRPYERISGLLDEEADAIPDEALRLRLLWLRAQLSYDAGRTGETLPLLETLQNELGTDAAAEALDESMLEQVKAHSILLQGKAYLGEGRYGDAVAALTSVREQYSGGEPAIYSYLVEARHYTRINRTVDAQQLLIQLADTYSSSPYAPVALYEAALNAQRRGPEQNYQEQAIMLLERLVNEHGRHELAFYAQLRLGDILRELNRFEAAELVYRNLSNSQPNHPDAALVQLSLADSYLAQASGDDSDNPRFSNAIAILERLADLPALPVDLRAEAGFKLAFAQARTNEANGDRAAARYWNVVSNLFLDEEMAAALGSRGRYWVARSLLEYGAHFEQEGRIEEAARAYRLIADNGLPGVSLARMNLTRLQGQ